MSDHAARIAWFKSVVLPHEAALRRYLRRTGTSATDIDDLVAEALTRAYSAAEWQRIDLGRSYLFTIARNLILDAARRNRVVTVEAVADLDLLNIVDETPSPEHVATMREELRHIRDAVDALPDRQRKVFLLRRIHELSMTAIADQLGLSVSTVEKHFAKAILLLSRALAEKEPAAPSAAVTPWQNAKKNL